MRGANIETGLDSDKGAEIAAMLDDTEKFMTFVDSLKASGVEIEWDMPRDFIHPRSLSAEPKRPGPKPRKASRKPRASRTSDAETEPEQTVPRIADATKQRFQDAMKRRPIRAPKTKTEPKAVTRPATASGERRRCTHHAHGRMRSCPCCHGIATDSVLIAPAPAPARAKKNDPVARYASFKKQWDADKSRRRTAASRPTTAPASGHPASSTRQRAVFVPNSVSHPTHLIILHSTSRRQTRSGTTSAGRSGSGTCRSCEGFGPPAPLPYQFDEGWPG